MAGIDSSALLQRILAQDGSPGIGQSDLTQALERIDRLQVKMAVSPLVLTYTKSSRKLSLADRAFLFFRRHGARRCTPPGCAPCRSPTPRRAGGPGPGVEAGPGPGGA